ncbi:thiamine phosphate synthase [Thermanaeromonas sp. C210]|uniref:thiamine phosphate synthase n=1 Tax=Thermanaeromonas sp. C210 TaxID=2731925 RepID=UPI00155D4403|nr:thiamine phosphate synthase [Thermanaeromonas sp. C210]GFN22045.1 thiamine-phosphate synthase [Thermanaeromonas sp. C210]
MRYDLYVVTSSELSCGRQTLEVVRQALAGGATVIQLREKNWTARALVEVGREIRKLTREAGAGFIVNDRLDVALAVEADGVHLGQDDLPASIARRLLGPGRILGVSVGSVEEAWDAQAAGADYLGVGPIFATGSKADAGQPVGPELISTLKRVVSIPLVAIGGINRENAAGVVAAGADGVAVISAVVSARDVRAAAAELLSVVEAAKEGRKIR